MLFGYKLHHCNHANQRMKIVKLEVIRSIKINAFFHLLHVLPLAYLGNQVFIYLLNYLSPGGSMIKFWVTTFWFMKVAWLWCFMFHRNQKVVLQNFIIWVMSILAALQFYDELWICQKAPKILNYTAYCTTFKVKNTFQKRGSR